MILGLYWSLYWIIWFHSKYWLLFMCMCMCVCKHMCACLSVCAPCTHRCSMRPEDGFRFAGTGVIGNSELETKTDSSAKVASASKCWIISSSHWSAAQAALDPVILFLPISSAYPTSVHHHDWLSCILTSRKQNDFFFSWTWNSGKYFPSLNTP